MRTRPMKYSLLFLLIPVLQSCLMPTQNESITTGTFAGSWISYEVWDSPRYLSIPDSLKSHESVGYPVSSFIADTYVFRKDGTYTCYAGLMDVEIAWEGNISINKNVLLMYDEYNQQPVVCRMRKISPEKIELMWEEKTEGKLRVHYRFMEKEPEY